MYLNFSIIRKYDLQPYDITFLAAIRQIETNYLIANLSEADYNRFKEQSLIKHIKVQKKGEELYKSLRLDTKGKKLLEELEEAEVLEEDKTVFEWLKNHYKSIGKEVGNGARTMRHIRDFRIQSGLEKNNLIKVCLAFLGDDDNMQYNNLLEYCFYKPLTAFNPRFNLEDSRLYKFYLKHKEQLEKTFEEYE